MLAYLTFQSAVINFQRDRTNEFKQLENILQFQLKLFAKMEVSEIPDSQSQQIAEGNKSPQDLCLIPQQMAVVDYATRYRPNSTKQSKPMRILVYAVPGAGKTRTAIGIYKKIQEKLKLKPQNILFLSFSRKSRNDIIEQLKRFTSCSNFLNVNTFHSLAMKILKIKSKNVFQPKDQKKIITEILKKDQTLILIKKINPKVQTQTFSPQERQELIDYTIKRVLTQMNYIYSNHKKPDNYHQQFINNRDKVGKYQKNTQNLYKIILELNKVLQKKQQDNLLTFQRIIQKAYEQLKDPGSPFRPNYYVEKLKMVEYVIIDQFQDCNKVQLDIVQIILSLGNPKHLVMLGDPNQNIYEWRQALSNNIKDFLQKFKYDEKYQYKQMVLKTTYRLPQLLSNFSLNFLTSNRAHHHQHPEQIQCQNKFKGKISIKKYLSQYSQARQILETCKKLHDNGINKQSVKWSDMTILVRSFKNNQLRYKLRILRDKYKIPMKIDFFDKDILQSPSFRIIKAFILYVVAGNQKQLKQFAIQQIAMTINSVASKTASVFVQHGKIDSKIAGLTKKVKQETISMQKRLEKLKDQMNNQDLSTRSLVKYIRDNFIKPQYICKSKLKNFKDTKLQAVQQLAQIFDEEQGEKYNSNYRLFLEFALLDERDQNDKINDSKDQILVQTIHQAKGLQWKVVFMPGLNGYIYGQEVRLEQNTFVSSDRNKDRYLSELAKSQQMARKQELRIIYTGITRPKYELYLSCSNHNNGQTQGTKKSFDFLAKISREMLDIKQKDLQPIRPSREDQDMIKKYEHFNQYKQINRHNKERNYSGDKPNKKRKTN